MKKTLICLTVLGCFLATERAQAQQEQYRWRVGAHVGSMLYYGDLNRQLLPEGVNPEQPAWGLSVERLLSNTWSGKLLYTQGQWVANDRTNDAFLARSLNALTEVQDYSLLFTYYLDNNRQLGRRSFVAPYFSFGLGYTDFDVFGDLRDSEGVNYHYWFDNTLRSVAENDPGAGDATLVEQDGTYETDLAALATERPYPTESFNLPVALGLKFRVGTNINLNLELLLRYAFTDYLDDVSGNYRTEYGSADQRYAANPTERVAAQRGSSPNVNDFYAFPSVSLHYSFARRKTTYRAPKLYAVAERVDRFTVVPDRSLTVTDTLATLTVDANLDSADSYTLSDSLRVIPHVVGQDTLLAIVRPTTDSLANVSRADPVADAGESRAARVDTLALIAPATLAYDTLPYNTFRPGTLIPVSGERAIRVQIDTSGTRLGLVTYEPTPVTTGVPYFGSFDPRPDSVVTQPTTQKPTDMVARSERESVPFSTLPKKDSTTQSPTPAVGKTVVSDKTPAPVADKTVQATPSSVSAADEAIATPTDSLLTKSDEPSASTPKPMVSPSDPDPSDGRIAVVPPTSSRPTGDTTALVPDTAYVATLNARMDTFLNYLDEVGQKNDTSFARISDEVEQLKEQLSNLQNATQPAVRATSIDERLRSIKLQELGTTEVFFGVGSSTLSAAGHRTSAAGGGAGAKCSQRHGAPAGLYRYHGKPGTKSASLAAAGRGSEKLAHRIGSTGSADFGRFFRGRPHVAQGGSLIRAESRSHC